MGREVEVPQTQFTMVAVEPQQAGLVTNEVGMIPDPARVAAVVVFLEEMPH